MVGAIIIINYKLNISEELWNITIFLALLLNKLD